MARWTTAMLFAGPCCGPSVANGENGQPRFIIFWNHVSRLCEFKKWGKYVTVIAAVLQKKFIEFHSVFTKRTLVWIQPPNTLMRQHTKFMTCPLFFIILLSGFCRTVLHKFNFQFNKILHKKRDKKKLKMLKHFCF